MSENYSRRNQSKTVKPTSKHLQSGFTALQKTLALVGSILSIIVASLTISKAFNHSSEESKTSQTSGSTTIIVQKEQSSSNSQTTTENQSSNSASEYDNSDPEDSSSSSVTNDDASTTATSLDTDSTDTTTNSSQDTNTQWIISPFQAMMLSNGSILLKQMEDVPI